MTPPRTILDPAAYRVAWFAPLEIEARAALHLLDNRHDGSFPMSPGNDYVFQAGDVCGHNVIIATFPAGQKYGTGSAAALASQVKNFFPNLWFGLLVGVAAGLPNLSRNPPLDIRLGDVLVGLPTGDNAGLVAYDLGKETGNDGFELLNHGYALANTATLVRAAIGSIKLKEPNDTDLFLPYYESIQNKEHSSGTFSDPGQDKDMLYQLDKDGIERLAQRDQRPDDKRVRVWYGSIGSGEKLMKNARKRDQLRDKYGLIGLEMEAAGTMDCIPVGVIRGVCDYGDEHKNKDWQPYAAAMAAAYAKAILTEIAPKDVPEPIIISVDRKRRLGEEHPHSISDKRRKRLDYGMHAHQSMIPERLASTKNSYSRDAQEECNKNNYFEVNEGSASPSNVFEETPKATKGSHAIDATTKQSLIDQLYFDKIDERVTHLTAAQRGTCCWFLAKPDYISWHDVAQQPDHGGLLWIKGHPGTGKSTLMKFLFEEAKSSANGASSQIILSFFFLARGTDDEKSATGLYRSLLHQLFQKIPEAKDSLEWMTADGAKTIQRNRWQDASLKQTLAHAVQNLGSRSLTIFVDALDECNQDQVADMVSFFEELCSSAREKQLLLRVCFSSRHYPTVTIQQGTEVTLENETGHTDDIQHYINSKLRIGKLDKANSLRQEILTKSSGIFLWVVLVLDILNHEYSKSIMPIQKMRDRLEAIPPRLNDLFQMILTRDSENRDQLKACLKWILFASRPLNPPELYFAVQFTCDKECSGFWDREDIGPDEMEAFVRRSSKGLAEVTQNWTYEVQFIHESVRDFLLGSYGEQWSEESSNLTGNSHEFLKDCCLTQLMSQDTHLLECLLKDPQEVEVRNSINLKYPFFEYATLNLFYHANAAQKNGIEQKNFLSSVPLQRWISSNNALEKYNILRYSDSATMLYIFSEKNLPELIGIHSEKNFFEVCDDRYGTPIFAALANNSREVLEAFLRSQAENLPRESAFHDLYRRYCQHGNIKSSLRRDFIFSRKRGVFYHLLQAVDDIFTHAYISCNKVEVDKSSMGSSGMTPLHYAAKKGSATVTTTLLMQNGINVNAQDVFGQTPLSHAAESGNEASFKALLAHGGIDVNIQDIIGKTPLYYTANNGNEAVLKALLAHGGININIPNMHGDTPLSRAADKGYENIVQLLLDNNANIESVDKNGETPLLRAAGKAFDRIVELLKAAAT
ncbi:uncharacterized protein TrAtP1_004389 [Trichoderma atroviride]|uniref:uncharacterized protein n=1 Tax=Hypocrea atroviridis TaxID=63577 RepID=UPI00332136A8|nr:hypothetical protein TrAtP1_004389 [Trichoderma atroviride]